jgi:hypothetical protein
MMDFFIGKSLLRGSMASRVSRAVVVSVRRNPYSAAGSSRRTLCDFSASIAHTECGDSDVQFSGESRSR